MHENILAGENTWVKWKCMSLACLLVLIWMWICDHFFTSNNITQMGFIWYIFTRQRAPPNFSPTMQPCSAWQCSSFGEVWALLLASYINGTFLCLHKLCGTGCYVFAMSCFSDVCPVVLMFHDNMASSAVQASPLHTCSHGGVIWPCTVFTCVVCVMTMQQCAHLPFINHWARRWINH